MVDSSVFLQGLPMCPSVIVPRARRVMALSQCSVKVVLPGSVAYEKNGRGIWQRNSPSHISNLGTGPFDAPKVLQESILLRCSGCLGASGLSP